MFATLVFSILASMAASVHDCEQATISSVIKQIEIADYVQSATPPPLWVQGDLYARAAHLLAACAMSQRHIMDSRIGDLIQSGVYAKFSAQAYLKNGRRQQACELLKFANRESVEALKLSGTADTVDKARLQSARQNNTAVELLLRSSCH